MKAYLYGFHRDSSMLENKNISQSVCLRLANIYFD